MTKEEIAAVLADHKAWLENNGGKRADMEGADMEGADMRGADMRGANMRGANMEGADMEGADMRRADMRGANMRGANMEGADMEGADMRRADMEGAKINNKTVIGILRRATRSDGFEFFLWHCQEGYFIKAGCRFLDLEAARQHWTNTRQGTPIGDESLDILDFFDVAIKRQDATK